MLWLLLIILILPNHAVRKWKRFPMSTTGVPGKSEKDILLWKLPCFHKTKKCHSPSTKRSFRRQKKGLSVQHTRIYNAWNQLYSCTVMWISKQDAGSCGGIWFRCAANVIAYKFGFVWKEKTVYDCNKSLSDAVENWGIFLVQKTTIRIRRFTGNVFAINP